jgi:hypothetical protein
LMMHVAVVGLVVLGYAVMLVTPCVVASRIDLNAEDSK